ncbi:GntR family transcriptional regulator [Rhodococcus sp. WS4]|nr:GntR family transcriptional regulator [Rhodococcus sp. WS4]
MSEQVAEGAGPFGVGLGESVLGELPPRDTTALVRGVRDRLRLAIALGEIPSGSRLNQVQLAKQLGVSRMPIRTAAAELVAEGLLEVVPGGGVAVRQFTERDLRDVFEVRGALESRAVRHVAEHQPSWGLANIENIVAMHKPLVPTYGAAKLLAADREFHMAILDATENSFFRRSIMPVWSTVERAMVQVLHLKEVFTTAWDEHQQIAEAMRAGDPDLAESRLYQHLENAASELVAVMPKDTTPPAAVPE